MECKDKNCPEHGELATRGAVLDGTVVSDKMQGTVTIKRTYIVKVAKYDRFKRRHSNIKAHSPPCINAKTGDRVKIAECRPLSKTVHFVVIEKLKK
jgi:small subunit ribosomal protein S17